MQAKPVLAAAIATLLATPALAQYATPAHVRSLDSGDAKSNGASFGNNFVVEAGDADSKATLNVSDFFTIGTAQTARYRFQASAPFDRKKADHVDVGTLSGLTAGTSLSLELSWVGWPQASAERTSAVDVVCNELIPQVIEGYDRNVVNALGGWHCNAAGLNEDALASAVAALNSARAQCLAAPPAAGSAPAVICAQRTSRPEARLSPHAPEFLRGAAERYGRLLDQVKTAVSLWTLGASANQQHFSYVLPSAPTQSVDDDQTGWGVTAAYTRLHKSLLWSVGFTHEETYKGAKIVDICSPIGTTGSTSCGPASLGAPKKQESELAFAEMRWIVRKLAMSPRVQFDTEESEWAVRVPVYLARNKDGAFTGGLAVGYSSEDDDVGISVFVGKEFGFFD